MKKVLSVLLALVMMLSLSVVAFADDVIDTEAELQAALNAGGTVVLGGDITATTGLIVPAGVTATLDLAGYTISGVDTNALYQLIWVKYGADLTVCDSGADGLITYDAGTENKTGTAIFVEGELTLVSGTIEITGDWVIGFAVDAHPNAWGSTYTEPTVFTMKGGKIKASDSGVRVANYSAAGAADSAIFNMEGGEIESAYDGIFVQHVSACDLEVNVSDGSITSENTHAIRIYGSVVNDVDVNITGGELNGELTNLENTGNGETAISGGTFSDEDVVDYLENGSSVIVGNDVVTKADDGTVSSECAHNGDWEWGCNEDIHVKYCLICEEFFGDEEPHEFGEWEVTKEPTKIHKGERVHVCEVCDYEEVETLSRVSGEDEGHLVIPESQKPAEDKDTGKANPATGSVEFVNVAIALGTVSLAAAAAVVLKK